MAISDKKFRQWTIGVLVAVTLISFSRGIHSFILRAQGYYPDVERAGFMQEVAIIAIERGDPAICKKIRLAYGLLLPAPRTSVQDLIGGCLGTVADLSGNIEACKLLNNQGFRNRCMENVNQKFGAKE